jgi:hypothetical protein
MEETEEQEFEMQEYLEDQLDYLEWNWSNYEGF